MQAIDFKSIEASEPLSAKPAYPRLGRAAHEFEASLMGELLKPMQQISGLTGDDEQEDGSGSALAGFATESLARVISERGGFGIAQRVLHELHGGGSAVATHTSGLGPLRKT